MFARPTSRIYIGPELRFPGCDHSNRNAAFNTFERPFDLSTKNIADLYRSVVACAKQIEHCDSSKGAYFVVNLRSSIKKEALYGIQRVRM